MQDAKTNPNQFKLGLNKIKKEILKTNKRINALCNIQIKDKLREAVIKFFDDYSSMVSESLLKLIKGGRLKMLTPKQMLQRLPIALSQLKPGNNSENFLNEIFKTVFSRHESKEITKKVYHNMINSIQI